MPNFVETALGAVLHPFMIDYPVWAVKLTTGKFLSERDTVWDELQRSVGAGGVGVTRYIKPSKRPFDWTLDVVNNGDWKKIKELWMVCPPNTVSPLGNTAKLPITEPGTAFMFKTRHLSIGPGKPEYHLIIGRVDNKITGDCTYFVYDCLLHGMSEPLQNNVYNFQSWRPEIGRIGMLGLDAIGLHLT
jgi:hypothetical protein